MNSLRSTKQKTMMQIRLLPRVMRLLSTEVRGEQIVVRGWDVNRRPFAKWLKPFLLASIMGYVPCAQSYAADMLGPVVQRPLPRRAPPQYAPVPPPAPSLDVARRLDVGGGFYLRGDLGIGIQSHVSLRHDPLPAGYSMLSSKVENTFLMGVGAGYSFNSWVRSDVTLDYRLSNKFSTSETVGTTINSTSGKISSLVALVNGYADVGNWRGIVPYLGLGVGYASTSISGIHVSGNAFTNIANSTIDKTKSGFAWALHAGASFGLTDNIKIDAGYRYLHLGKLISGCVSCTGGRPSFHITAKDYYSHDLRIGLRYYLNRTVSQVGCCSGYGSSYNSRYGAPVMYPQARQPASRYYMPRVPNGYMSMDNGADDENNNGYMPGTSSGSGASSRDVGYSTLYAPANGGEANLQGRQAGGSAMVQQGY